MSANTNASDSAGTVDVARLKAERKAYKRKYRDACQKIKQQEYKIRILTDMLVVAKLDADKNSKSFRKARGTKIRSTSGQIL